jgi:hypothetical protein
LCVSLSFLQKSHYGRKSICFGPPQTDINCHRKKSANGVELTSFLKLYLHRRAGQSRAVDVYFGGYKFTNRTIRMDFQLKTEFQRVLN